MNIKVALLFVFALAFCEAAYNTSRAYDFKYLCAATFGTEAEINSWTCKYCPNYKLINVTHILKPRLKHSITLLPMFSDILGTLLSTMQSLLHSEAL